MHSAASFGLGWLAVTFFVLTAGQSNDAFRDPSPQYRPKFRYWLPDASISADVVAKDVNNIRDTGAGGIELLPFYLYGMGEKAYNDSVALPDWSEYGFGTSAFNSLFKSSLQSAKDAGVLADFALGANQGQGVPSEVETPGLAVELLMGYTTISARTNFSGPVPVAQQPSETLSSGLGFMHPRQTFSMPNLTAVIAYQVLSDIVANSTTDPSTVLLNQGSYVDLTSLVKDDGSLQWAPSDTSSSWKVFSFWESYTNQRSCDGGPNPTDFIGNGSWTVDHFSKAGAARVTDFWDEQILADAEIASLIQSIGEYAWEDSMEMLAALYWTPGLLKRFKDTYDYDLTPCLPLLFTPSNTWNGLLPVYNEAYRFGNDTNIGDSIYQSNYRKVLNDGYQDYLTHFVEWTHSIGIKYSAQPAYNLPLEMLSDIPYLDVPEGESLGFTNLLDAYRQFSGPAHLANQTVISTEMGALETAAYSMLIPDLLQQIKRSLAGGFTMHVLHGYPATATYPNTTWPGYTTFWYQFTDMWNPVQPAWQHMKDTLDYVGRTQWVLQQGVPKVDLAFHLYASPWMHTTQYNSTNLSDLGYTYDYLGPENLVSSAATVNGKTLGVPAYKALIFNEQTVTSLAAAKAVMEIAITGLPVIIVGSAPSQPYPTNASSQFALSSTMNTLLTTENVYQIESIDHLSSKLSELGILPRVALDCTNYPVYSVYRSAADADYVYIFNDQGQSTDCTVKITTSGKTPYIYNAWTGTQYPLLAYTSSNSSITFPITLQSNETTIIALQSSSTSSPKCTYPSVTGAIHSLTANSNQTTALVTGAATLTDSSGKTIQVEPVLPASTNLTSWDLIIEDWHSAPDRYAVETDITNYTFSSIALVPWTTLNASFENVSGVGHYTTTVTAPTTNSSALIGILTLPFIQHTARVYLDGAKLQPIDPTNPVVELGELEGGKEYEVRVEITTTLFNRVKSELDQIWVVGQVAKVKNPKYDDMAFQEYGLVGEVKVVWGERVVMGC